MNDPNIPDELKLRIGDLEAQLKQVKISRNIYKWSLIALFGCFCLYCLGIVISFYRTTTGFEVTNRSHASQLACIKIPESATNFHCYTEKFLDQMTCGRFDIPKDDLKQILSQMPGEGKHGDDDGHSHVTIHDMKLEWWKPELLSNRKIIEWTLPNFEVQMLYGDNGMAESITVYFFNFTH